jgi:hypothetical protein
VETSYGTHERQLVGNPKGKKLLRRPKNRYYDNIKMRLNKI